MAINVFLFGLLFGLVTLNKEVLRPMFSHIPFAGILAGSFPNFIAAYIISLAFVNPVVTAEPKYGRHIVYISSVLVFVILTVEELKPMWGASTYCDLFDILGSGLGSLLSIMTFELIILKRKSGHFTSEKHDCARNDGKRCEK
ncbi:MAG: hypothetical protein JW806_07840 [Sedimentisphaerales bacterium]|nr:hypothetical protein [Sedimentisphaerales bacterium]